MIFFLRVASIHYIVSHLIDVLIHINLLLHLYALPVKLQDLLIAILSSILRKVLKLAYVEVLSTVNLTFTDNWILQVISYLDVEFANANLSKSDSGVKI